MELNWVDQPPTNNEGDGWEHDALAALARAYAGKWIAVPQMPSTYVSAITSAVIPAYRPEGEFEAFSRAGTMYLTFVGSDPTWGFVPREFPPVKAAVLEDWQVPRQRRARMAAVMDVEQVAAAMRGRPGAWLEMPPYLVTSSSVVRTGMSRAFAPAGSFEACTRAGRVYARFVGDGGSQYSA